MQGTERGADLDAEVFEQGGARGIPRHTGRDLDGDDVVHLVGDVAEHREPERLDAREHRPPGDLVPVDDLVTALEQQHARALPRRVQHARGLGVVVQPARTPVVEDLPQIEVVRAHEVGRRGIPGLTDARLDLLAGLDHLDRTRAQRDRRRPARAAEALLQARSRRVEPPGIRIERVAAERRGRIGVEDHPVAAADLADVVEGLIHRRRSVALHEGEERRPHPDDRLFDDRRREHLPPVGLDRVHLGERAFGDLGEQVPEPAEHRHEHAVARAHERDDRRFDARTARAVDQHRRLVAGVPDAPVELLRLSHRGGHERVVLADERGRHRPQHARVRRDRARAHEQPCGRIDRTGEGVRRGGGHTESVSMV